MNRRTLALGAIALLIAVSSFAARKGPFTTDFHLQDCTFATEGENAFFVLRPGRLVLEGVEDGDVERVVITILDEFEPIVIPGLGVVMTRVVEERETVNGELVEVSRNFFAVCGETSDVFYFGEDVDNYNEDGTITHEGAWRAGEPDGDGVAEAGIIMPGRYLLGSRYFQEIADDIALDRAEHVGMNLTVETPAGTFTDCVEILETSPLDKKNATSTKSYCRGIGLVADDELRLIEYQFNE